MTIKHITPGLYLDVEANALHVHIPELLAHFGYANTPGNRDICAQEAETILRRLFPTAPIHQLGDEDGYGHGV